MISFENDGHKQSIGNLRQIRITTKRKNPRAKKPIITL